MQDQMKAISRKVSEGLQSAKSGAAEGISQASERLSEVGQKTAKQARQAAEPIQAAAQRAKAATMQSTHRSALAIRNALTKAKQVNFRACDTHTIANKSETGLTAVCAMVMINIVSCTQSVVHAPRQLYL